MRDLKKKRPLQEIEEEELPPQKGTKQQKTTKDPKDKRSSSVDSREEQNQAEVCLPQRVWSPRLEVDGLAFHGMPLLRSIKEVIPHMWLSPWSSHFFCLRIWRP